MLRWNWCFTGKYSPPLALGAFPLFSRQRMCEHCWSSGFCPGDAALTSSDAEPSNTLKLHYLQCDRMCYARPKHWCAKTERKEYRFFYICNETPINHTTKTQSNWTNIWAVRWHCLWLSCQSEMFAHGNSPFETNTERLGSRNINKDTETSCQCAQSVLITLKAVWGARYILGPYPFFILFGMFPSQLTLSKNERSIVSLMMSSAMWSLSLSPKQRLMWVYHVPQRLYVYSLSNSSLPLYSRGTAYHLHVVDKLRHKEDKWLSQVGDKVGIGAQFSET